MRKVTLMMAMSLDGHVATADGGLDWIFPNIDDRLQGWINDTMAATDAQLIGRANYEEQAAFWPTADGPLAPLINSAEKVVFSRTLTSVDWKNTRLAEGDAEQEIAALRARPGKDILVPGGARFAQHVSALGLVEVYKLIVHPVVLGGGLPLFASPVDLRLEDAVTFDTGAVALTYTPR